MTTMARPPALPAVPLVSALMPTSGRPGMAARAARCFLDQDHPRRELVVVPDGDAAGVRAELPRDQRIRVVPAPPGTSIGAKRNLAAGLARGDVLVHWDDDDWHGPRRISQQVVPLIAATAEITGLRGATFLDVTDGRFWRCGAALHRRMFRRDVPGGTVACHRAVWDAGVRWPDTSLAEDADFLDAAVAAGARLRALPADGHFVYVRHGANTWRFRCGRFLDLHDWVEVGGPRWDAATRIRFGAGAGTDALPLVSCIMPTADRPRFVVQAIDYFRRQRYPHRELVVVDDGRVPVVELMPAHDPAVRYLRLRRPTVLGAKRNLACEAARGSVIAHFDDDDFYPAHRLDTQVGELLARGAEISGAAALTFVDPVRRRAWRYRYRGRDFRWLAGTTLCYRREVWAAHRFANRAAGEDNHFLMAAAGRAVADVSAADCAVAVVHAGNTSTGQPDRAWARQPYAEAEQLLGPDAAFYRELGEPSLAPALTTAGPVRTGRRR